MFLDFFYIDYINYLDKNKEIIKYIRLISRRRVLERRIFKSNLS